MNVVVEISLQREDFADMKRDRYPACEVETWEKHEYNRDAYTDAKKEFVEKYTIKAKEENICLQK